MITNILFLVVGAAIGWNFPQPQWAKDLTEKVKAKFASVKK